MVGGDQPDEPMPLDAPGQEGVLAASSEREHEGDSGDRVRMTSHGSEPEDTEDYNLFRCPGDHISVTPPSDASRGGGRLQHLQHRLRIVGGDHQPVAGRQ